MTRARPFANAAVAQAFEACPPLARKKLLALRELNFDTAAGTPGVGALEESLKWGEPADVTNHQKVSRRGAAHAALRPGR